MARFASLQITYGVHTRIAELESQLPQYLLALLLADAELSGPVYEPVKDALLSVNLTAESSRQEQYYDEDYDNY